MGAPTGVLLGSFTPGTPEWEAARGGLCITATEIPAVLGLSPWQSPFSLWHKKAGLPSPPFEVTPEMEWGTRHEPAIAQKYADEHPEITLQPTGTWRHKDRHWQRATPDQVGDDRLVEVKFSPWGEGWGPSGSDDIPVYYRAQVQWQMDVLGCRRTDFAVLIQGFDYREYTVLYDAADAELMRKRAMEFLDTVRRGERPPIDDSDATYQTIRRQHPGREDIEVDIPADLAARYETASADLKTAEDAKRLAVSEVLDLIGENRWAVVGNRRIAQRLVRGGKTHSLQPMKNNTQKEAA